MDMVLWRKIMVSLIYPAVHGAGLVWLISEWAEADSIPAIATNVGSFIALWLVLFYGVSYAIIDSVPVGRYNPPALLLDLAEIALVFICFVALGYVNNQKPNFTLVFGLLAVIPILQSLWNHAVKRVPLWPLSLVATAVCGLVAMVAKTSPLAVIVGTATLYALLIYYLMQKRHAQQTG